MIKDQLLKINDVIENKKQSLGISYPVKLMAVSKTFPIESIKEAINENQILFGENRILEAYDKFNKLKNEHFNFDLHLIGHIQRNKAKQAVEIANCIQSIDKIETLDVIEKICAINGKIMNYLIEINTSNEEQKQGVYPDKFNELIESILKKNYKFCNLTGLMTIGPLTGNVSEIRKSFKILNTLFEKTKKDLNKNDFVTKSMGMSGDFEIAIEEGSNLIRIGSLIFGIR